MAWSKSENNTSASTIDTTTFEKIRKRFEPAFCYIIIENNAKYGNIDDFKNIAAIISQNKKEIIKKTFYRDRITQKLLLLIKIEPARADWVKQMILDINLPKDIAVYFYYI